MKHLLVLLLCSSSLLNAMTESNVKQNTIEGIAAQLKATLFAKAYETNDLATVKTFLAENYNTDIKMKGYNFTPLLCALRDGKPEMVQVLIAYGAELAINEKFNIDTIPDDKKMSLLRAIEVGTKEHQERLDAQKERKNDIS